MVPSYRPDALLRETIRSVLAQDPGPEHMQITVVDDGSEPGAIESLLRPVDPAGRVEIRRSDERLGLAGNWNRAITLARGHVVHLLHQDDWVLPGFYARLLRGFDRDPEIAMAFCRSRIVDGSGRTLKSNSRLRWLPGVLDGWLQRIAERQRVQTPAALVARSTYEAVGGYRPELRMSLDWEMWVRIAAHGRVWYEPRTLAVYRRHAANETTRLVAAGLAWPDVAAAIAVNARVLPAAMRDRVVAASVRWHVSSALRTVETMLADGAGELAIDTLAAVPTLIRLMPDAPLPARVRRRFAALAARLPAFGRRPVQPTSLPRCA